MSSTKNMTGLRFGRLSVLKRAGSDGGGKATWLCRCDCGRKATVTGASLRGRNTKSCGCYGQQTGHLNTTHGHLKSYQVTSEYVVWRGMLARCYQPHNYGFRWYGGRGIGVCKRWRGDFAKFIADVGTKPAADYVFSRKNKDDGYRPGNCEWSPARHRSATTQTRAHTPRGAAMQIATRARARNVPDQDGSVQPHR
jgi:hypothetical protein